MKCKRIIARLDVKNNALVKGIHLEGLRVLGSPEDFAKKYYIDGIDEIIYMDVVASLYGRNGLLDLVQKTAKKIFIPLTVGGGVRSLEDVGKLLKSGADKVCINTAAVKNPELISKIVEVYGSSTIVVAIEAIKVDGEYLVFIDNGREYTGIESVEWAKQVEELGAGEILLTSVDQEGTKKGLDHELISLVTASVNIPVIAHGGVGSYNDIINAFDEHNIDAVCAASFFHYDALPMIKHNDDIVGNKTFIKSQNIKKDTAGKSIYNLKKMLINKGVAIRQS